MNLNFKLKLLLLGLMVCINLNNASFSIEKNNFDYIEKWAEVGSNATGLLNDDTLSAANTVLNALENAFPYAGTMAVAVIRLLGVKTEFDQILDKLEKMNKKLDQLDSRLNDVLNKIESVHIMAGYKAKVEQIINLKHAYERFTGNPTNDTRDDFKAECGSNKMMVFARWIESEVNAETHLPLRKVMLEDFDMRNFNYWSNQITALLSNAIFLHSTCLGVSGYNETIISETLYGTNGSRGDIEIFKNVLKNVKKGFNQGVKYIKRAFFSHARQEVRNFMVKHSDLGHQEFADKLYHMLSVKYFWRLWGVVSFKAYLLIPNDDREIIYDNFWYWDGKRTFIVGSVLPDKSNTIYKKLEDDIDRCRNESKSNDLIATLNSCNINTYRFRIDVLMRVYKKISPKFSGFYNPYNKYTYRVDMHLVAVPGDPSATITDGEVCSPRGDFCSGDQHCCPKSEKTNEYFCCPDTAICVENGCK